ncbi:CAP domain-containing protein [Myxococcus stipitatus]|uniref:CAP domain-containing protein n=1 Tax=Myxococcus stipitatus TaxID=83455 RepID=UPI0031455E71
MNRSCVRRLLALGLLVPWLSTGCDSEDSPEEDPPSGDAGIPDGGPGTPDGGETLSQFARDMLDGHNATRAAAKPVPSPALVPVTWDTEAENTAKAYAAKCEFKHNPNRGNLGENLYAATPDSKTTRAVVEGWSSEINDYNYATNSCAQTKMCGHYTQIVWRNTKRIGCATQVCTENSPWGAQWPKWQLWVCNYAPPGNYVGERPY